MPDMLKNSPMLKRPLGARGLGTGRGKNVIVRAGGKLDTLVINIVQLVVVPVLCVVVVVVVHQIYEDDSCSCLYKFRVCNKFYYQSIICRPVLIVVR